MECAGWGFDTCIIYDSLALVIAHFLLTDGQTVCMSYHDSWVSSLVKGICFEIGSGCVITTNDWTDLGKDLSLQWSSVTITYIARETRIFFSPINSTHHVQQVTEERLKKMWITVDAQTTMKEDVKRETVYCLDDDNETEVPKDDTIQGEEVRLETRQINWLIELNSFVIELHVFFPSQVFVMEVTLFPSPKWIKSRWNTSTTGSASLFWASPNRAWYASCYVVWSDVTLKRHSNKTTLSLLLLSANRYIVISSWEIRSSRCSLPKMMRWEQREWATLHVTTDSCIDFDELVSVSVQHAGVALSALIRALDELQMVAIVRYAYDRRSNPQVGAAFPCIKQNYEVRL